MCDMLISINPEHVENIFNGTKKYEYRKIRCKQKIDKIIIYSTFPIMKIVGEAKVDTILEDTPKNIWNITKDDAGINLNFYNKYYEKAKKAVAYKLTNIKKYESFKELSTYGIKSAPQSFVYV